MKVILASSSKYFHTMFLSGFKEKDTGRVELQGVDVATFEDIIKFIYTAGQLQITTDNAQALLMVKPHKNTGLYP